MQRLGGTGSAFLTVGVICLEGIPDVAARVVVYGSSPAGTARLSDTLPHTCPWRGHVGIHHTVSSGTVCERELGGLHGLGRTW